MILDNISYGKIALVKNDLQEIDTQSNNGL